MRQKGGHKVISNAIKLFMGVIFILLILVIYNLISTYFGSSNYPVRFKDELDNFFGEGNWECTNVEKKTTSMFSDDEYYAGDYTLNSRRDGTYRVWTIQYVDSQGNSCEDYISNFTHFMHKTSNKTVLAMELHEIALNHASDELERTIAKDIFTQDEIENYISIIRFGTVNRPETSYYKNLLHQDWFKIHHATPLSFLSQEGEVYTIDINLIMKNADTADKSDIEDVKEKATKFANLLVEAYGKYASFDLTLRFEKGYSGEECMEGSHTAYYKGEKLTDEELNGYDLDTYLKYRIN
ncbi:MAG: hypothetical protein ACI4II_08315 [Acutalibacteraceae bacterium]